MRSWSLALVALALLAACAEQPIPTLQSNPSMYAIKDRTASMRSPQRVTLINAYPAETKVPLGGGFRLNVNLQEHTNTAISMMGRHLASNGIIIDPGAEKKVTLKVRDPQMTSHTNPFYTRWRSTLALEAVFADGTSTLVNAENIAPSFGDKQLERSMDGAVLRAVTSLLNDGRFVAYMNSNSRPGALSTPAAQRDAETRLDELKRLHDRRLINDEEYNKKRKEVLDSM